MSAQKNVEWLRHRTKQYRSTTNDMCEFIEDFDEVEKLGQGFSSANPLEEIDIVDFIVGHSIDQNNDESCNLVSIHPLKLFFDGSACREGQRVGVVLISPRGAVF
jgi:hypothetical protein